VVVVLVALFVGFALDGFTVDWDLRRVSAADFAEAERQFFAGQYEDGIGSLRRKWKAAFGTRNGPKLLIGGNSRTGKYAGPLWRLTRLPKHRIRQFGHCECKGFAGFARNNLPELAAEGQGSDRCGAPADGSGAFRVATT